MPGTIRLSSEWIQSREVPDMRKKVPAECTSVCALVLFNVLQNRKQGHSASTKPIARQILDFNLASGARLKPCSLIGLVNNFHLRDTFFPIDPDSRPLAIPDFVDKFF